MKKIICLIVIFIAVNNLCFAEENKQNKTKEKLNNDAVIGVNGGATYNINTEYWNYNATLALNVDFAVVNGLVLRFGGEFSGNMQVFGAGVVLRKNIGKNIFAGGSLIVGCSNKDAIGFRTCVLFEYKFSKQIGIGVEPAYNFVLPSPYIKNLTVAGGLRLYIE